MKNKIYTIITKEFSGWSKDLQFVCTEGCHTCCTQNVTVTGLEAEIILEYIRNNGKELWLANALNSVEPPKSPAMTTNEFAAACFNGEDSTPEPLNNHPCPFLENGRCSIYEVRPFGCRCFNSEKMCSKSQPAVTSDYYLSGSTVAYQLIEHLGQGEYWGNMLDVLAAMCDASQNSAIREHLHTNFSPIVAKLRLRTAKPLPGFLLPEEDHSHVDPLLNSIFASKIDHRNIEEILNGKK